MLSKEEIGNLYDKYSEELFRYIRRFVCSHETAEDLLHDLFVKFIRYIEKKPLNNENIRALLYSIARSVCLDHLKKRKKTNEEMHDAERISVIADNRQLNSESDDIMDFFNTIIDTLPEPDRSVILMRKNGLTFEEISISINISVRTAKRKAQKSLEIMRKNYLSSAFYKNYGMNEDEKSLY